jgi:hypothetical protein
MKKEFVPHELALRMKQLGFDEPCLSYYEGESFSHHLATITSGDDYIIPAPLYQQAFRWFREKYKVRFFIQSGMSDLGEFFKVIFPDGEQRGMSYITYEEAELACLQKLIEIVKTK